MAGFNKFNTATLPNLDSSIPPPPCKPPKQPDAIERLEAWLAESQSRTVELNHEDGWRVWLGAAGASFQVLTERGHSLNRPENVVVFPGNETPGLAATIHAAIDRAEELGL